MEGVSLFVVRRRICFVRKKRSYDNYEKDGSTGNVYGIKSGDTLKLTYDTIPSLFYDDTDYTPEGRLRWSGERYRAKVERAGAVIGRMAMPLAGVYGVENEEVVKDLVRASDLPYSYVHRTLNTLDGMDFALLYYADRFFTERIETGYGYLCVEGMLDGKPTAVLLTRGDRYAAELLEELRERTPGCVDYI
jgi:hypothetical protein